jgi:hypothetical protein
MVNLLGALACVNNADFERKQIVNDILAGAHSYFVVSSFKCKGENSCHDNPCVPEGGNLVTPLSFFSLIKLFLLFDIFPSMILFLNTSVMKIH